MYGMNVMYVMTNLNAENSQLNFTSTEIIYLWLIILISRRNFREFGTLDEFLTTDSNGKLKKVIL